MDFLGYSFCCSSMTVVGAHPTLITPTAQFTGLAKSQPPPPHPRNGAALGHTRFGASLCSVTTAAASSQDWSRSRMASVYAEAGTLLHQVLNGRGLKDAAYNGRFKHTRAIFALVAESLKRRSVLDSVAHKAGLLQAAKAADIDDLSQVIVMVYDVLWGSGKIRGGGKLKRLVMGLAGELKAALSVVTASISAPAVPPASSSAAAATADGAPAGTALPRYIRVNRVQCPDLNLAWTAAGPGLFPDTLPGAGEVPSLAHVAEPRLPGVLSLPAATAPAAARHKMVASGQLVLQDRSSCLPAIALLCAEANEPAAEGDANQTFATSSLPPCLASCVTMVGPTGEIQGAFDVLDACAAPGNKTACVQRR